MNDNGHHHKDHQQDQLGSAQQEREAKRDSTGSIRRYLDFADQVLRNPDGDSHAAD